MMKLTTLRQDAKIAFRNLQEKQRAKRIEEANRQRLKIEAMAHKHFHALFGRKPDRVEERIIWSGDLELFYSTSRIQHSFRLRQSCEGCGLIINGYGDIYDLESLGEAISNWMPNSEHPKYCDNNLRPQNIPSTWSYFDKLVKRIGNFAK